MRYWLAGLALALAGAVAYSQGLSGIGQQAASPGQALDATPTAIVCAYSSSPPTGTSGTFIFAQCNSTGYLMVH